MVRSAGAQEQRNFGPIGPPLWLYNRRTASFMASLPHGFGEPGDVQDIRLVVDTIPVLAWSAGPDGFNQRRLDYTGLSTKQALDSGWEVAIHPDNLPRSWKHSGELRTL